MNAKRAEEQAKEDQGQITEQQSGSKLPSGKKISRNKPPGIAFSYLDNSDEKIEKLIELIKELLLLL